MNNFEVVEGRNEAKSLNIAAINEEVQKSSIWINQLKQEISRAIIGQKNLIDRLLVALLSNGHVLIEGVPGLGKTLALKTLASTIEADFKRIQFTPDMLPADIIGTQIYNPKEVSFFVKQGPIFTNFLLADEINRAPAKVQSALLEAMQERQVTIGDKTYKLPEPFLVMATQNPLEQEGTYPLPEAQIDRFMLKVVITYPTITEERVILDSVDTNSDNVKISPIIKPEDIKNTRNTVNSIYMDDKIKNYIVDIVYATREPDKSLNIKPYIHYGASPRATINLKTASKAMALINGKHYVGPEDVKAIAMDVLRHRVIITYEAEAEAITSEDIIRKILDTVPVP
ncbi:MAG: MoxR family ATPase [Desulfobacterales bacterium]|nr:MoxR family ATPase [Desulfobacterales bacterium]